MGTYPSPDSLVLVAVITSQRDLEIARLLGWYRLPLRRAPKVISVDALAFYQTGAFGPEQRWKISCFAEVRGHELTTRRELFRDEPDHPRANEEYYRLALGPLQALPQSIPAAGWKRITFLYTTGSLFPSARSINDLVVRTEERQVLWRTLRERALQRGLYRQEELPEFPLDPLLLAMLGGMAKRSD